MYTITDYEDNLQYDRDYFLPSYDHDNCPSYTMFGRTRYTYKGVEKHCTLRFWCGEELSWHYLDSAIELENITVASTGEKVMAPRFPVLKKIDTEKKFTIFNQEGFGIQSHETLEDAKTAAQKMLKHDGEFVIFQAVCKVSPKPLDALIENL